jgi:hypothetical protein
MIILDTNVIFEGISIQNRRFDCHQPMGVNAMTAAVSAHSSQGNRMITERRGSKVS